MFRPKAVCFFAFLNIMTKNSYLGVDIGVSGIKVVEFEDRGGRAVLLTYGFSNRPPAEFGKKMADDAAGAADLLKKICAKAGAVSKKVVASLPIAMVFSALINAQADDEKNLKPAIEVQAAKLSPWPVTEIVLDWKIVSGEKKEGGKNFSVLLTGAQKILIKKYVDIFRLAGLELLSLETEAFALMRSLVGEEKGATMILDVGGERTNIVIINKNAPTVSRSIDLGGKVITDEFARRLGIGAAEAEEVKLDAEKMETLMQSSEVLKELYGVVFRPVMNEIKYCMELYASQNGIGAEKIEKIILTGGSCLLPGLAAFVGENFKIRAYVGDPWARTIYPEDLRPLLDRIGPRFAVAIGLAMRSIAKK